LAFLLAILILGLTGCERQPVLKLHYLPGFVAGSEHVLPSIAIAVLPTTGSMATGTSRVGAIYNDDGSVLRELYVRNPARVITGGAVRCLSDAGLKPMALADGKKLPPEVAAVLAIRIESIAVDKHFGPERTVHGQYFSMAARVQLRFTLSSRTNPDLYSTVTTGVEQEPPKPVGGEVFLPLETEPAEALSVALSRAIGALILQPQFRVILQRR
jgi:hypothetical protein